jgi:hypothetical protein
LEHNIILLAKVNQIARKVKEFCGILKRDIDILSLKESLFRLWISTFMEERQQNNFVFFDFINNKIWEFI